MQSTHRRVHAREETEQAERVVAVQVRDEDVRDAVASHHAASLHLVLRALATIDQEDIAYTRPTKRFYSAINTLLRAYISVHHHIPVHPECAYTYATAVLLCEI